MCDVNKSFTLSGIFRYVIVSKEDSYNIYMENYVSIYRLLEKMLYFIHNDEKTNLNFSAM